MYSLRIIFLVVFFVGLAVGQIELQPPGPLEKAAGETVVVFCDYLGSGNIQPRWTDPDNNVVLESGTGSVGDVSVTLPNPKRTKLEILNFKDSQTGRYECEAGGTSQSITITIYKSLEFTNVPPEQKFEVYNDANIVCEVTSNPPPSYEWKFESVAINQQNPKYEIVDRQYLTVKNISKEDQGTYTCLATVFGGNFDSGSRDVEVIVLVPPKITLPPESINGTVGGSVMFKCIATGNPEPSYSWTYNNNPIANGGRYAIMEGGEKLVIGNLEKADTGSYACIASIVGLPANRNAERSAFLNVFVPPVVKDGEEKIALENDEVEFSCSTVGGDPAKLTWRRFGEDMPLGPQQNSDVVVEESQGGAVLLLKFASVKRSYNGSYECHAKNLGGEGSSLSNLTVLFAPVIDASRTKNTVTSWIGNEVTMTCFWLSNPPATYYWRIEQGSKSRNLTDEKYVVENTAEGESSITFTPENQGQFDIYQCVAYNTIQDSIRQTAHNIELKTAAPPDAPTAAVQDQGPATITLRIEAAEFTGGLDLVGFNISWTYEMNGQDVVSFRVYNYIEDESRDDFGIYIIDGLASAKQYMIKVAAFNDYRTSEPSEELIARTLATREPYAPRITSPPESDKETEYLLTWEEPKDSGTKITGYKIQFWEYDVDKPNDPIDEDDKYPIVPVSADYREYIIPQLEKATDYRLELWAENAIGEGDRRLFSFKTAGQKTSPTIVETSSSLPVTKNVLDKLTTKPPRFNTEPDHQEQIFEKGTIIGIVIAAFLIVLIVIDISCCIVNDCGLTMCLCVHCCGRQAPGSKSHEIEMGEEKENGETKSQQMVIDETLQPGESTNQQPSSCDVTANGADGTAAAKGGKGAYTEIREDGDGSAPTEPPVEKDKLIGSETKRAPPLDEKTPMLSDQDLPASDPAAPGADGDAKADPPATEAPAAEPAPTEAEAPPPAATDPEPAATETPAEPPSESTPDQNTTDEAKGELADEQFNDYH